MVLRHVEQLALLAWSLVESGQEYEQVMPSIQS
jgi:hypothetical protein